MTDKTSISKITLEFYAGSDIVQACREASATARLLDREVEFTVNGVTITVSTADTAADLVNRYWIHDLTAKAEARREARDA